MIKARGQLRHCFFGEYSAVIALGFHSEEDRDQAHSLLGNDWKKGEKVVGLVCVCNSEQLEGIKEKLGEYGADVGKIDSCKFSIDYGEPFECSFPYGVSKDQLKLF